jgi:hypothetical protein
MPCITHETPEERAAAQRHREHQLTSPLHEEIAVLRDELKEREAMLCGVLTALSSMDGGFDISVLDADDRKRELLRDLMPVWYDGREAGVCWSSVEAWWMAHQERDRHRRAVEAEEREAKKQRILARLTAEERDILGLG